MKTENFLSLILPHANGCSVPLAESMLLLATDEFCRKSRLWREDISDIVAMPGQSDYEFELETPAARVVDIDAVHLNGSPLSPVTPGRQARANHLSIRTGYAIAFEDGNPILRLSDTKIAGTLDVRVILSPVAESMTLPDFLYADWREALASGTLARLFVIPDQPFTRPELVDYHEGKFRSGIVSATSRALSGNVKPRLRVRSCYA